MSSALRFVSCSLLRTAAHLSRTPNVHNRFFLLSTECKCLHLASKRPLVVQPARLPVQLLECDLHETFSAGGGKGGQKVNRSNNKVNLKHIPTGLTVHCHRTRSLHDNRRIARSMLTARLDELLNGAASRPAMRVAKLQRRKAKARQRTKAKQDAPESSVPPPSSSAPGDGTPNA